MWWRYRSVNEHCIKNRSIAIPSCWDIGRPPDSARHSGSEPAYPNVPTYRISSPHWHPHPDRDAMSFVLFFFSHVTQTFCPLYSVQRLLLDVADNIQAYILLVGLIAIFMNRSSYIGRWLWSPMVAISSHSLALASYQSLYRCVSRCLRRIFVPRRRRETFQKLSCARPPTLFSVVIRRTMWLELNLDVNSIIKPTK